MLTWIKERRVQIGFAILAVGVAGALLFNGVLLGRISAKDNATRCSVVGLVLRLSDNSRRNHEAIIASSSSTLEQKQVAQMNLNELKAQLVVTETALGHPHGPNCPTP